MFIEDALKERAKQLERKRAATALYVGKHPTRATKSVVILPQVGCVFIGNDKLCQEYIAQNSHRF